MKRGFVKGERGIWHRVAPVGGVACVLALSGCGFEGGGDGAVAVREVWRVDGFSSPESALFDPQTRLVYVSNMDGGAVEKDFKGSVVAVDGAGNSVGAPLAVGLHAPKGMALAGRKLYVADIDALAEIDLEGATVRRYPVEGARFLNDVAVLDGVVYLSDMQTGFIHRFNAATGSVEVALREGVGLPNGLLARDGRLLVASWGEGMRDDFSTEVAGRLFAYDPESGEVEALTAPVGNLDGLAEDGEGRLLFTDWIAGKLFLYRDGGGVTELASPGKGSADLGYHEDARLFLVPLMLDNAVAAFRLEGAS